MAKIKGLVWSGIHLRPSALRAHGLPRGEFCPPMAGSQLADLKKLIVSYPYTVSRCPVVVAALQLEDPCDLKYIVTAIKGKKARVPPMAAK